MKLTIITVDFNGRGLTDEFLKSAEKLKVLKGWEIKYIVIDNASDIPVWQRVDKTKLDIDWLQTGDNAGFAGGFNRGISYGRQWGADYFLIVNNDVVFPDHDFLIKMFAVSQSDPKIGVVSPKILFAPGFEFHKGRYTANEEGKVIWYAGGKFDWDNVNVKHRGVDEVDVGQFDSIVDTDFASGCCMLVRREVFANVGEFAEKLFAYYEDADLALRVKNAGWRQVYTGQTKLWHKVSQSAGAGSQLTDYLTTRNQLFLGFKYAHSRLALVRQALKLLFAGRDGQKQGVRDYFANKFGRPDFLSSNSSASYPIKLSIVVINYQTVDLTRKCLQTITNTNSGAEVILIDNASGDDCATMVKEFPQVKFIANTTNRGFSGANNQGIDYSRGEYILLLNSDAESRKNSLKSLVAAADQLGGKAITAGRLFFPDGSDQDSVFNLPTPLNAFKEYFLRQTGSYFMFRPKTLSRVECAVMACFMIPRRVINKIGMLDEGTFMYFEDVEYCRRAKQNNIPVYFVPEAEFVHHHGASSKKIGQDAAYTLLKKGSYFYHGAINYWLLYIVLWLGQRFGAKSPTSRWKTNP